MREASNGTATGFNVSKVWFFFNLHILIQLKITAARTIIVLTLMIFICKDLIMNKQVKINDTIFQFKKMRNKLSEKRLTY